MPVKDITNQVYNRWKVIERAPNSPRGDAMWLCECSCENHTRQVVKGSALRSGHSKSCGCLKKEITAEIGRNNSKNLVGQVFSHLKVLEKADSINQKVYWKCQCDCEDQTITYVSTDKLTSGHTCSCGCLTRNNLTGKQFGNLIALEPTSERGSDGSIIWKTECQCSSRNIVFVPSTYLTGGRAISCGCTGPCSLGEATIKFILDANNIPYMKEATFPDCRFSDTNGVCRFDFYVNNSYLIEFDGEQHFSYRENGRHNKENYQNIVAHDNYKNEWCRNHNIPLIRIPYYIKDKLELKDLQPETSQYII